jgi:hypothetical protein
MGAPAASGFARPSSAAPTRLPPAIGTLAEAGALEEADKAGEKVVIHCSGGAARTATVRVACAPPDSAALAAAPLVPWRITAVEEPRTCAYIVHATAAAVCEHPSLADAAAHEATGAARVVECRRVEDGEEGSQ